MCTFRLNHTFSFMRSSGSLILPLFVAMLSLAACADDQDPDAEASTSGTDATGTESGTGASDGTEWGSGDGGDGDGDTGAKSTTDDTQGTSGDGDATSGDGDGDGDGDATTDGGDGDTGEPSPECTACLEASLGPGGVCEPVLDACLEDQAPEGCFTFLLCLNGCQDAACEQQCVNEASPEALAAYDMITTCGLDACPECQGG